MFDNTHLALGDALSRLGRGKHICLIYEQTSELLDFASLFVQQGLDANDKCICISPNDRTPLLLNAVAQTTVDPAKATRDGRLSITPPDGVHLIDGRFDADHALQVIRENMAPNQEDSGSGKRMFVDMTWAQNHPISNNRLVEYEASLNTFVPHLPCLMACAYDRTKSSDSSIVELIRMHPFVITGGELCPNYDYAPPEEVFAPPGSSLKLDRFLQGIVDRHRADRALAEDREIYAALINTAGDGVALAQEGRIKYANAKCTAMLGYQPGALLNKSARSFVAPEDLAEVPPGSNWMKEEKSTSAQRELKLLHQDGTTRIPVRVRTRPTTFDGRPAILGLFHSVPHRSQERTTPTESNTILDILIKKAGMAVFLDDSSGIVTDCDEALVEMLGLTKEQIVGHKLGLFAHPGDRQEVVRQRQKLASDPKTPVHYKFRRRKPDGLLIQLGVLTQTIDEDHPTTGGRSYVWETTDSKETAQTSSVIISRLEALVEMRNREISEYKERLSQSHRLASIGTLYAGVANDISDPIGTILLAAENALRLIDSPEGTQRTRRTLSNIAEDAKRCGELVKKALRFAHNEMPQKWPLSIVHVLQRAIRSAMLFEHDHTPEIELHAGTRLPSVEIDPTEMEQAFACVIEAASSTAKAGEKVTIGTQVEARTIVITVKSSAAMAADAVPSQDKASHDVSQNEQQEFCSGSGVSIAQGIFSDHGGSMVVESTPGHGKSFVVSLPIANTPSG